MTSWDKRYIEFYEKTNNFYILYKDLIWVRTSNFISKPLVPAEVSISVSEEDVDYILNRTKSKILRVSKGFIEEKSEWWYVICDKFKDVEEYPSKIRSEIKRGLRNCQVKLVDADFIARHGYDIYIEAFKRYKEVMIEKKDEKQFINYALSTKSFEDILHWWGVFVRGKLVGYSHNSILGEEVRYAQIKLHPNYLEYYPSYALIYTMNRYYLNEKGFKYINDGNRTLFHFTDFQEFIEKKFNFRKVYSKLEMFYSPLFDIFIKILYPFRGCIPNLKYLNIIKSLLKQEEIRKSFIENI